MIITKTIVVNPDLLGITPEQKDHQAYILKHNLIEAVIQEVKKNIKFHYDNVEDTEVDDKGNHILTASIEIK
jgi:hypothetical protein